MLLKSVFRFQLRLNWDLFFLPAMENGMENPGNYFQIHRPINEWWMFGIWFWQRWTNSVLMQVVTKCATNKVTPVMVSTRGSVVPGNVYWHLLTFVDQEFCSKCSHRIFSIILTICKYKHGWPKLRNVADSAKIYNGWSKTCGRTQCYARLGTFGVNYNI